MVLLLMSCGDVAGDPASYGVRELRALLASVPRPLEEAGGAARDEPALAEFAQSLERAAHAALLPAAQHALVKQLQMQPGLLLQMSCELPPDDSSSGGGGGGGGGGGSNNNNTKNNNDNNSSSNNTASTLVVRALPPERLPMLVENNRLVAAERPGADAADGRVAVPREAGVDGPVAALDGGGEPPHVCGAAAGRVPAPVRQQLHPALRVHRGQAEAEPAGAARVRVPAEPHPQQVRAGGRAAHRAPALLRRVLPVRMRAAAHGVPWPGAFGGLTRRAAMAGRRCAESRRPPRSSAC
eukprot:scaffold1348_cov323-Prasinococcus_capsulatus_cf.AAC.2